MLSLKQDWSLSNQIDSNLFRKLINNKMKLIELKKEKI